MNQHEEFETNPYEEAMKSSSTPMGGDDDNPSEPPAQGG